MKHIARALLALALFLPTLALAQATAESRAEAGKMLDAMDMQGTLDKIIEVSIDSQLKAQPALEPYRPVLQEFFRKYMSYASLKPKMVEIYAEAFTAQELAEIRAWYAGPTGRKALKVMPSLMQKGAEIGQQQVEAHMPELVKMVQDQTDRLKQQEQPQPAK
jgi:hypothetical protein